MQASPLQHPAHRLGSQTHAPPLQRCPVAHGLLEPHPQVPSARQVSLVEPLQSVQLRPLSPHVDSEGDSHTPCRQHPAPHVELLQAWATQRWLAQAPEPQSRHAAPPLPQALGLVPLKQTPPLQHPEGHEVASQVGAWQLPASQAALPQLTHAAPPAPQADPEVPATHAPEAVQHPVGQLVASQAATHAWAEHVPFPHDTQAAPPWPHAVLARPARHTPF